jgi:hypothetical protein
MTPAIAQAIVDAMAATHAALLALGEPPPESDREARAAFLARATDAQAPLWALADGVGPARGQGWLIAARYIAIGVWAPEIIPTRRGLGPPALRRPVIAVSDSYGAIMGDGFIVTLDQSAADIVERWRHAVDRSLLAAEERLALVKQLLAAQGTTP